MNFVVSLGAIHKGRPQNLATFRPPLPPRPQVSQIPDPPPPPDVLNFEIFRLSFFIFEKSTSRASIVVYRH